VRQTPENEAIVREGRALEEAVRGIPEAAERLDELNNSH
jgi:hypothetical protein